MSVDEEGADLLIGAIGEFREELIQWIDNQLAQLRERETRFAVPVNGNGSGTLPAAEPVAGSDARHRLDALARQLNERLRNNEESPRKPERADRLRPPDDQARRMR
jgi:hypothetical protein